MKKTDDAMRCSAMPCERQGGTRWGGSRICVVTYLVWWCIYVLARRVFGASGVASLLVAS